MAQLDDEFPKPGVRGIALVALVPEQDLVQRLRLEGERVPRPGSTKEGDGYLIGIENRLDEMASRLLLFDAMNLAPGPIATIGLPFRIRPGLHGNWVPK
jgi:carotenoid cleavage dioxygenase-like enzyme